MPGKPFCIHRRYSFMYRYLVKAPVGETRTILVKIPRDAWMTTMDQAIGSEHIREVVLSEFSSLGQIDKIISASGNPHLTSIHPAGVIHDHYALVMEEKPMLMLKSYLSRSGVILGLGSDWRIFESRLIAAGEWLRLIHDQFSSGEKTTLEDLKIPGQIDLDLEFLEEKLERTLPLVRSYFSKICQSQEHSTIPLTSLHNDFQLGNIFETQDGKIGSIDPNWLEGGSIYNDLASLLIDPVTRKNAVLTRGCLFRPPLQTRYERAVLSGYYGNSRVCNPILYLYCATKTISKWLEDEDRLNTYIPSLSSHSMKLSRIWVRGYFYKLVLAYLKRGLDFI
jgi:hypothetical protein